MDFLQVTILCICGVVFALSCFNLIRNEFVFRERMRILDISKTKDNFRSYDRLPSYDYMVMWQPLKWNYDDVFDEPEVKS